MVQVLVNAEYCSQIPYLPRIVIAKVRRNVSKTCQPLLSRLPYVVLNRGNQRTHKERAGLGRLLSRLLKNNTLRVEF